MTELRVKIQKDKTKKSEYIIKDTTDIVVGRFTIYGSNNKSKACNITLMFYRNNEYYLLSDTLTIILKTVFNDGYIFKLNIQVNEQIDVNAFLNLGFTLEGIFNQNEYVQGEYIDQLSFGITRTEFNQMNRLSLIELKGENITLKNLTPGNSNEMLEYYKKNKNHLAPFEPTKEYDFYTLETQQKLLKKSYRELLNGTSIDLGIFKNDKIIGKIKLSRIIYGSVRTGILGYSIDENEQGKGYMQESVKLMLRYAFKECELHKIEASALISNEKSQRVLIKCGFKLIGISEKYLMINGKWQDHAIYYINEEDFK